MTFRASFTTPEGWRLDVECVGRTNGFGILRDLYRWRIVSPEVVEVATGESLSTPAWQDDPEPERAAFALGSFLSAWAEHLTFGYCQGEECEGETHGLFPSTLPVEGAQALANELAWLEAQVEGVTA